MSFNPFDAILPGGSGGDGGDLTPGLETVGKGAGAGFLSSLIGTALPFAGQYMANEFNRSEARKNRQFQMGMSSSAYQRSVRDLKAAGLNPMLAYSQGGASTTSGDSASMDAPDVSGGINSAIQLSMVRKNLEAIDAGIEKTKQETSTAETQAELNRAVKGVQEKTANLVGHNARTAKANATILEKSIPAAENEKRAEETWFGKHVAPHIKKVVNTLSPWANQSAKQMSKE